MISTSESHHTGGTTTIDAPQLPSGMTMPLHVYQALVEQSSDGIAIAGTDSVIVYANSAFRTMTGLYDQAVGTSFFVLYPPETQAYIQANIMPALMSGGQWQGQLPSLRPDGTFWITQISVSMIVNPIDGSRQISAMLRDVSVQHAHEQRLRMLESLVEQATIGMALTDMHGNHTYANTALRELTGYGDDLLRMNIAQLTPTERKSQLAEDMATFFATGRLSVETVFQCHDGTHRPVHVSSMVIYDNQHVPIATAGIIRDLSEERRTEQEHRALQEQIIFSQQLALQELSTPLIPIIDGVVAMPLIGTIDTSRAQRVIETLLSGVAESRATTVILDITGVPLVDTQVASALLRAAQAVKLLGATVTLTGIRPEVAQTLVSLGVDLSGITMRSTLQSGIVAALRKTENLPR